MRKKLYPKPNFKYPNKKILEFIQIAFTTQVHSTYLLGLESYEITVKNIVFEKTKKYPRAYDMLIKNLSLALGIRAYKYLTMVNDTYYNRFLLIGNYTFLVIFEDLLNLVYSTLENSLKSFKVLHRKFSKRTRKINKTPDNFHRVSSILRDKEIKCILDYLKTILEDIYKEVGHNPKAILHREVLNYVKEYKPKKLNKKRIHGKVIINHKPTTRS